MRRISLAMVALTIAGQALAAAPDWQDQRAQSVYEPWVFLDSHHHRVVTAGYRAFISGADSSDIENQADFTAVPADSAYYLSSMRTGARIRSGRFDIYKISPGADSLIHAFLHIEGRVEGKDAVDDTCMADGVVLSRHILDRSIQSVDIDTGAVGKTELSPALAAAAFAFTVVDTFKLSTSRAGCGDRSGSKYVSWPAISVIIAALGLLAALANGVRSRDMEMIDTKISSLQKEVALGRDERLRNQTAITTALNEQNASLDRRLTRIEERIDLLIAQMCK
jgi:hypothetical protein